MNGDTKRKHSNVPQGKAEQGDVTAPLSGVVRRLCLVQRCKGKATFCFAMAEQCMEMLRHGVVKLCFGMVMNR